MKNLRFYMLLSALAVGFSAKAQVVITEIMQSNVDCVMDDLNEFPDSWVEIHNFSGASKALENYSIGLTDNPDEAWKLPSGYLKNGEYKLIYCDKEATGMHTDFRLDSGKGGSIYLFENNQVIDKIENIAKQPAPNISYGRKEYNSSEWGYQKTPTPATENCGEICAEVLGEPVFETPGNIYPSSTKISVTLSLPADAPEGTQIYYTFDGTEPTTNSTRYKRAITFSESRVIRAKLFCDGYLSRPSTTHSYILHTREVTLPVISIVTDNSYFYDAKKGIYVEGSYSSSQKNYQYNWRRPANFEYFTASGQESDVNQLCELRCAGAASRGFTLKSLALYANKRFGNKHFKYELFPKERPENTDYKSIMIRNAGNDFDYLYMRDAMIQRSIAQHLDIDYQAWQPAIFYLNGKYMGMLNVRERGNESNIYTNYDRLEDIDIVENWGDLKEGTWDNLSAFKQFYNEHGHTLEEYSKWLDIDEYINFMAMNAYYNNVDFPANNMMMWRPRTDEGRWRFIAKDVDYALGIYGGKYNYNYFSWLNDNSYDSSLSWGNTGDGTRLFRRLMEIEDFKDLFLERLAIFMGSFLNYNHVWKEIWEPMYNEIKFEYPYHRQPINQWWPNYNDELTNAQNWMKNRTSFFYGHMADYYNMGTMEQMKVNNNLTEDDKKAVSFTFNDVELCGGSFDGKYFPGHNITLKGTTIGEKAVKGWSILRTTSTGQAVNEQVSGDTYTVEMPQGKLLQVNAILADAEEAGIEQLPEYRYNEETPAEIYDLNGVRYSRLPDAKGIYIINGQKFVNR